MLLFPKTLLYTMEVNVPFPSKPNILIDFDGVVHDHKHPLTARKMGGPIEGAKEALDQLSPHFVVVIFCTWADTDRNKKIIEDWLFYYNIYFDDITNIKRNAACYIDDKAVRFTNWDEVLLLV